MSVAILNHFQNVSNAKYGTKLYSLDDRTKYTYDKSNTRFKYLPAIPSPVTSLNLLYGMIAYNIAVTGTAGASVAFGNLGSITIGNPNAWTVTDRTILRVLISNYKANSYLENDGQTRTLYISYGIAGRTVTQNFGSDIDIRGQITLQNTYQSITRFEVEIWGYFPIDCTI